MGDSIPAAVSVVAALCSMLGVGGIVGYFIRTRMAADPVNAPSQDAFEQGTEIRRELTAQLLEMRGELRFERQERKDLEGRVRACEEDRARQGVEILNLKADGAYKTKQIETLLQEKAELRAEVKLLREMKS